VALGLLDAVLVRLVRLVVRRVVLRLGHPGTLLLLLLITCGFAQKFRDEQSIQEKRHMNQRKGARKDDWERVHEEDEGAYQRPAGRRRRQDS
jgi:hypothetical protein